MDGMGEEDGGNAGELIVEQLVAKNFLHVRCGRAQALYHMSCYKV
jgi:hypothetical protein